MKICIFTAVFGMKMKNRHTKLETYAQPLDPEYKPDNIDFIYFTDKKEHPRFNSKIWELRTVDIDSKIGPIKMSKLYKILAYKFLPEYDISIWMDTHCVPKLDKILEPLKYLENNSSIWFKHDERNCIYDEVKHCDKIKKDKLENMTPQIKKYKNDGFPENFGLTENTIHWKRHDDPLFNKCMDDWWEEVKNGSIRDQICLMYCFWKNNYTNYKMLDSETENMEKYKTKYYKRNGYNDEIRLLKY
jgi:hypothetical protein